MSCCSMLQNMVFKKTFKVGIGIETGSFELSPNISSGIIITGGFEKEILEVYAAGLKAEFKYIVTGDSTRKLPNNTWRGAVGLVHRNEVDFSMGTTLLSEDRAEVAIPSAVYRMEEVHFATRLPNLKSKLLVFIEPFEINVWISIIFTFVIISAVVSLIHGGRKIFLKNIFSTISVLLNQSSNFITRKIISNTIVFTSWILMAKLLSLFYTSCLLSYMIIPRRETVIDTVEKLLDVVEDGKLKIALPRGVALYPQLFLNSNYLSYKKLGSYAISNNWFYQNSGSGVTNALENNFGIVIGLLAMKAFIRNGVVVSEDVIYSTGYVIYMNKNFCCSETLNRVILRADAGGIYLKTFDHYCFKLQFKAEQYHSEETIEKIRSLNMEDLQGCFVLFVFGMLVSIAVFVAEVIIYKRHVAK